MKNNILGFIILAAAFANMGCNHEKLMPLNMSLASIMAYGTVDAHVCTTAPSPAKQKLKYLFILDHSSSNQPGFPLSAGDIQNSDSNGSRRYGPLVNFVRNIVPDPNNTTYFSIIDFNDAAVWPTGITGFDSNTANFLTNATNDWIGGGTAAVPAPRDAGFTDYQAALRLAEQMIRRDVQIEAAIPAASIVTSTYQIIFVTDGAPTINAGGSTTYTQTFATDIRPVIQNIMNLKFDPILGPYINSVVLNTAYYFNAAADAAADALLNQMASAGNGQYMQFGSGRNILYQQFAPPSRNVRNQLIDVFVENKNGLWWDDGRFMMDSDSDGLPDLIEIQNGSNLSLADSDGNGVSDLVEYRTKGRPCDDAACAPLKRDRYAICAGFNPVTDSAGRVTFAASTNDGLNDCEKFLLGANRNTFNTNGNLIPDLYAFKNTLPVIPGSGNSAFSDPFGDGLTNYSKLKVGMPIQVSNKVLADFEQRNTIVTLESSPSPVVDCYHVIVGSIALSSSNNNVKVMIVQNGSSIQDKPFLQTAERQFGPGGIANFMPTDFR